MCDMHPQVRTHPDRRPAHQRRSGQGRRNMETPMMIDTCAMESGSLVRQIMHTLTEGVAITDRCGQILFVNRALEQLLGYDPGELIGLPWATLFPEPQHGWAEAWQIIRPGEGTSRFETRLLHKDGLVVPALASSCRLSDGNDHQGTLSIFTNLRGHHHLQDQIHNSVESSLMGEQLASIVHELSNSLTILLLQAQVLSSKGTLAPPFERSLTVIREEARRMIHMVDTLRATADPHQVSPEDTDINALLERTLDLQAQQLKEEFIHVTTDLDASLPVTSVDADKLQRVFVNLINNARQALFTSDRPSLLSISTHALPGDASAPTRIQIRVSDNGPGIPADVMPHVFEPFFTTKPGHGMGLGLFICEKIVHNHGGQIWAETNAMGGATFIVQLPATDSHSAEQAWPSTEQPSLQTVLGTLRPDVPQHHILVVDDEPALAEMVGQTLRQDGFKVTTATQSQQALALLDQNHVDLIVSDLSMPPVGGRAFWQTVRERYPRLAGRIIVTTGNNGSRTAETFLQDSDCTWIEKPVKPAELLHLVHEALPGARAHVPRHRGIREAGDNGSR
jgi:two-component system cell cycle sensor histidine kinase/response regulator CckA